MGRIVKAKPEVKQIIDSAEALWSQLKSEAGMDSIFYDKALIMGTEDSPGLYETLAISESGNGFEKDLNTHKTSVSSLLVALLSLLQPYASMMEDLYTFFEKHGIKKGEAGLSINFDFNIPGKENLKFDINHFKEIVKTFREIQVKVSHYQIEGNTLWKLNNILQPDYFGTVENSKVQQWIDDLTGNRRVVGKTDIILPSTGHSLLDRRLEQTLDIWKSYVNACRKIDSNANVLIDILNPIAKGTISASIPDSTWTTEQLLHTIRDNWPASYLGSLISRLEEMATHKEAERREQQEDLLHKLDTFFDELPFISSSESRLVKEFTDLLNLPVWKHRHELYAAWILTTISKAVEGYPVKVNHEHGVLTMSFKATLLATIEHPKGNMELWSEVRSPLDEPVGKSRIKSIQPDYAIYRGKMNPENCLAAIEVKQYRRGGTKNFSDALQDYAKGLKNAKVMVVNYGKISSGLKLPYPDRNSAYGCVYPQSIGLLPYLIELKKCFPAPELPAFFPPAAQLLLLQQKISEVFIDVSASLDSPDYKEFLTEFLSPLIQHGLLEHVNAVDEKLRGRFENPEIKDIEALIALDFGLGTNFVHLLPEEQSGVLIITDEEGAADLKVYRNAAFLILVYSGPEWILSEINNVKGV